MNRKTTAAINTLSLAVALIINYLSATGGINGTTVGDVSDRYSSLITPAGYAFEIWSFIYLWLIAFVGYQWYAAAKSLKPELWPNTGGWFALANLANAAWVLVWVYGYIGFSVLIMFFLLLSLIVLVKKLRMEVWDAPVRVIAFVWWPICWYLGWIILATVTNVAAFFVSIGWGSISPGAVIWAIIMIGVATAIYLALIFTRNLRELSLVGAWGFVAIAVRHWGNIPSIVWTAIGCSVVLLLATAYHGNKKKETSPAKKWKRGEI